MDRMIKSLQYSVSSALHNDMTVLFVSEGTLLSIVFLSMVLFAGPVGPRAELADAKETLIGNAGLGGADHPRAVSQPCGGRALLPDLRSTARTVVHLPSINSHRSWLFV